MQSIPVPLDLPPPVTSHPHSLDIDGVFLDADGFGGNAEQVLGGFSFVSAFFRCNQFWVATVNPETDGDGWSNAAELRLGSNPGLTSRTPEHGDVPTTLLYGPDPCHDSADNDSDGQTDAADAGCLPAQGGLTVSPPTGFYVSSQSFDLVLIVQPGGSSIVGGSATFDTGSHEEESPAPSSSNMMMSSLPTSHHVCPSCAKTATGA